MKISKMLVILLPIGLIATSAVWAESDSEANFGSDVSAMAKAKENTRDNSFGKNVSAKAKMLKLRAIARAKQRRQRREHRRDRREERREERRENRRDQRPDLADIRDARTRN